MKGQIDFWSSGDFDAGQFVNALLPLSIQCNPTGTVLGCSSAMAKAVEDLAVGVSVFDFIDLERPNSTAAFIALNDPKYFVVVSDKRNGNRFKCTKFSNADGGFLLVLNPMLNEQNSPVNYRLEVSDFAPHDIIAEYLFVMKANQMGMREANELIADMTQKNNELKLARHDLLMLNERLEQKVEMTGERLRFAESELKEGEKLALLGRLAAGVAHEMNTPLGAITSSVANVSEILKGLFKDGLAKADHATIKAACSIADAFSAHQTLSSREERLQIALLTDVLEDKYGLANEANDHARRLVECGILAEDVSILDHIYDSADKEVSLEMTTTIMRIRKSISTIEVAAQKAATVVRALKSYVRNDANHDTTVFDLKENIQDVLLLFGSQLRKGVDVQLDVEEGLSLQGNRSEISKIWSNLIANAIHAMNSKGNIWIHGRSANGNVVLSFTNDGPPIPDEVMPRLFEPFYTTKPVGEGSGMGLSIIQNVVNSMGGSIDVKTGPTTTFTVTLPKLRSQ